MTVRGARSEIQNLSDLLLDRRIAIYSNPVGIVNLGERKRVTWMSKVAFGHAQTFASIDEYRLFVRRQWYSVVLFDGSLLQMTMDFKHGELVRHRFCYYPCPVYIDEELLREEPLLDSFEMYFAHSEHLRLRTPMRFDYDIDSTGPDHSPSHVHFQVADCRCPVIGPIGIGMFIGFVFSSFYPDLWREHGFLREWRSDLGRRTIGDEEAGLLHFSCVREFPRLESVTTA